jgi:4-hydroxybenzoate polyprenyltransferase
MDDMTDRLFKSVRRSAVVREHLPWLIARLGNYALLMRMDKPIGTLLLLWPTLWALWLASSGRPQPWVFTVFLLGTFLMRSAGCVVNDLVDRDFDGKVARTRGRPLATGAVSVTEAMVLAVLLALVALLLVLTLNALTVQLAFVAAALAACYPFMKRWTYLPQLVLGAAFGWAIPMAFAAELGRVPQWAWLLFLCNVFWTTAYDTLYAMVDRPDDVRAGIKSTAILFGELDRFAIGVLQIATLLALLALGRQLLLGPAFHWGLAFAAGTMLWQQWLIRRRRPDECFRAFQNNAWTGAAVFAGIAMHYIFNPY